MAISAAVADVQRAKAQIADAKIRIAEGRGELAALGAVPQDDASTSMAATDAPSGPGILYYTLCGRAGQIEINSNAPILIEELEAGLIGELPTDETAEAKATREKKVYSVDSHGTAQVWVPNGAAVRAKNKLSVLEKDAQRAHNIMALFSAEECVLSREALRFIAAFSLNGFGASDEVVEMIVAGTIKAVLHDGGFNDLTSADIAKGCPSRRTIERAEQALAADSLVVVCQRIKDDGASFGAVMVDHGNRNGQEHFVKVLIWEGRDGTPQFFCLDTDQCSHSADDCADAIKQSLKILHGVEDFKIIAITGDSGGGAGIHRLHAACINAGIMDADSKKNPCLIHNLNKAFEEACETTFGKQGIGHCTPWQMLYLFALLFKRIRQEGGSKLLEEYWGIALNHLLNDGDWQEEARTKFSQAYQQFLAMLDSLDSDVDEDIDAMAKLFERPVDIQDPVFSRWGTVALTNKAFLKHYPIIYFVAVAVKQSSKSNSYLWQIACALLALMNTRADPVEVEQRNIGDYVRSFTSDAIDDTDIQLKPGDSPTFYTMLLFVDGFHEAFFKDMFEWTKRNDPVIGPGSHGQMARLCVERLYVMHSELSALAKGWRDRPEFQPYLKAVKATPNLGAVANAGREFFEKAPACFFSKFRFIFDKQVTSHWRSDPMLYYMLSGNPELAKRFSLWLQEYYQTLTDDVLDDDDISDDDSDSDDDDVPSIFPDREIVLRHHQMSNGPVSINIQDCMLFITEEADRETILEMPFIKEHWYLIKKLGYAVDAVDLFDEDTWGSVDYSSLVNAIRSMIVIHPHQSQRIENYVQLAASISKTLVGEDRRSYRAMAHSIIMRPFNLLAVENKRATIDDKEKKKKIRRAEGSYRIATFAQFMNDFGKEADAAREKIGDAEYRRIRDTLKGDANRRSTKERKAKTLKFSTDIQKKRVVIKAEMNSRVDVTAQMGGGVLLHILTRTNNFEPHIDAECEARNIKGYRTNLTIGEKKKLLRTDELKIWAAQGKARDGIKQNDVNYIVPQSEMMKSLVPVQEEILAAKAEKASLRHKS